jgi:hypothetical protein
MKTFPTLTAQQPGETAEQFGIRAFSFLVTEGIPVGCIEPSARAAALHFSLLIITAPDVHAGVRARYADVRFQLAQRAAADQRRLAALSTPDAPVEAAAAPLAGGSKVVRPTPPTKPTPPSAGVSLVTGNPLPDAATRAARLAAARRGAQSALQAVASFAQQNGGGL